MATKRAYDAAANDSSNSNSAKRSKLENFDSTTTSVRFKKKVLFYIQVFF